MRLQEGTSSSCHRVKGVPLEVDNFDNFHNTETWISHRKMQLEGKFPQAGCQYCEQIEKNGGISDRLTHLKVPNLVPAELELDPTALIVTPRIIEVFLDNVCNLACIYCDESNSTRIEQENKRYGYTPLINQIDRHKDFEQLQQKFFEYLEKNYHHFRRLQVLGGEPFFQNSFNDLMTVVKANSNPDLTLNIVTSLMVSKKKLQEFIDTVKDLLIARKLKNLEIMVSIDCWGPEQEYVRHGLNMSQWQENFELLSKQKWITLNANSTITSLTVKGMPDLIKFLNVHRKYRKIHHTFGHVDGRPHQHCNIFGKGFFDKEFNDIIECMPATTVWERNQIEYMKGIHISLNDTEVNPVQLKNLKEYLDELDRRRNQNWIEIFPWLDNYFKENNINVV